MINSKMIYRIMGFLLLIETAMLMCCGGVSLFYKEDDLNSFLLSSAITAFVGVIMLCLLYTSIVLFTGYFSDIRNIFSCSSEINNIM